MNLSPCTRTLRLAACSAALLLTGCQLTLESAPADTGTGAVAEARTMPTPVPEPVAKPPPAVPEQAVTKDLWQRMRNGFRLQASYHHAAVDRELERYRGDQRFFELISQRASPFLYFILEQIEQRDLPAELALVPVVESTFNPNAYSPQHAVGLWQFMGATATRYGLQRDWWFDGRRDPRASTLAALTYLEELHAQFKGNWLLALAAYNTGDGNLRRALDRTGQEAPSADYWSLPLAPETRYHVARVLALARIVASSEQYAVELPLLENREPLRQVQLAAQIDLSRAAAMAGITTAELRALNPGYRQWATHPDSPHSLLLPAARIDRFESALASLPSQQWVTWDRYLIEPGDTLGGIARRLGTRVDVLQTVNQLRGSTIVAGRSLLIPRSEEGDMVVVAAPALALQERSVAPVPPAYTVRRGDNLWTIARRFDLRSRDIALWNGFELDAILRPGQQLDLQFARGENSEDSTAATVSTDNYYQVRRGDSLLAIAARLGTPLADLLQWNALSAEQTIFPGQRLRVAAPASGQD